MRLGSLTSDTPLTNAERLALWRAKLAGWRMEQWYELTHPDEPAVILDSTLLDWDEIPPFLRKQAG
jgi:hypothetical protein